jgi:hypothetical protein
MELLVLMGGLVFWHLVTCGGQSEKSKARWKKISAEMDRDKRRAQRAHEAWMHELMLEEDPVDEEVARRDWEARHH